MAIKASLFFIAIIRDFDKDPIKLVKLQFTYERLSLSIFDIQ